MLDCLAPTKEMIMQEIRWDCKHAIDWHPILVQL